MRTTMFDFTSVRMIDLLDGIAHEPVDTYPPYNIEKTGEQAWRC